MISKITPVKVIHFTKISVALACAWPPPPNATKSDIVSFKILWHVCYLSNILLLLPLLSSIYEYRDDPVILAKSVCLSCAAIQVTIKMMVCRIKQDCFQMLYHEVEMFCKQANEKTNIILQYYVDNYKRIYGIYILWVYMTAIGVIFGPLILPQEFPTYAKYPFSTQPPIKYIIYLHQSLVGIQAAAGMCIDCNFAILLFYSVARLDLLIQKIRNVKNENELDECIKLHDEILRYTNKLINVVRPLIFTTIMTTIIGVVFGGLNLVTEQPIMVKIQYSVVVFIASVELFMCALPADNLIHMSSKMCEGAYESQWFQGSMSMQKKILQIMFRSQKPEVISIDGILPALSFRYYAGVRITI
ncbi:Putative odorant receptor 49a [Cyphomyrmex costatus]|uniref:Odorant receptor n=1 Tax=Cyphomyrmex costatus TaxID=456900 RepID=A0A195CSD3_9HYME|nr:Putative odorant receptor 49a [Cyphomyrmex costatus]